MAHLVAVSLIWAFSFGLIRRYLPGADPNAVAAARLLLSLALFLPFLRLRGLGTRTAFALVLIGAVEFGVMYVAYHRSYRFLAGHEVALLTLLTPVYVTLLESLRTRRLLLRIHAGAILAVAGGVVVVARRAGFAPALAGALLVQVSNLAFAAGQLAYKRLRARRPELSDARVFALLYAGAAAVALAAAAGPLARGAPALTGRQILVIAYLGLVASGAGFFLWNLGAVRVREGALAVMNNLKVPLGVLCALLVFGEPANLPRLIAGGTLILAGLAVATARQKVRSSATEASSAA